MPVTSIEYIEGRLHNDITYRGDKNVRMVVDIDWMENGEGVKVSGSGIVEVYWSPSARYYRGDSVRMQGEFIAENSRNNYSSDDVNTAVRWRFFPVHIDVIPKGYGLPALRRSIFTRILERIEILGVEEASLLRALFLGDRSRLDPIVVQRYRESGNAHVLALSGMHLSLIFAIILFFLSILFGRRFALCTAAIFSIGYCIMVGPIPSLMRALFMVLVYVFAVLFRIQLRLNIVLYLSVLLCSLFVPTILREFSFLLSSAAILGIAYAYGPILKCLRHVLPSVLASSFAISIAPILATAPFVLAVFGEISTGGIATSVILGLMISVYMVLGFAHIIIPEFTVISILLEWVYDLSFYLVSLGKRFPRLDWIGFSLLLFVCIGIVTIVYVKRKKTIKILMSTLRLSHSTIPEKNVSQRT